MTNQERQKPHINKKHETRTKEISKMIDEGGLGADKYYEIEKNPNDEQTDIENNDSDK